MTWSRAVPGQSFDPALVAAARPPSRSTAGVARRVGSQYRRMPAWRPSLLVAAAGGLLLSGLLPWFHVAIGPDVSGFRMAGLVLAFGDLGGRWPPTWVGLAWFSVPIAGAVTVLVVGWTGGERRLVVVWAPAVCAFVVATCALVAGTRAGVGVARGPALAVVSAATIVSSSFAPRGRRRSPTTAREEPSDVL